MQLLFLSPLTSPTIGGGRYFGAVLASPLGHPHVPAGDRDEALKVIGGLHEQATRHHVPAFNLALVYVGPGEKSLAFDRLNKAVEKI